MLFTPKLISSFQNIWGAPPPAKPHGHDATVGNVIRRFLAMPAKARPVWQAAAADVADTVPPPASPAVKRRRL